MEGGARSRARRRPRLFIGEEHQATYNISKAQ